MSRIYKTTISIGNEKGEEVIPKGQYIEVIENEEKVYVSFQSNRTKKVSNQEHTKTWLNRCLEQNAIIEEEQRLGYTANELREMMQENIPREDIVIEILKKCYEAINEEKRKVEVEYKFTSKESSEWVKDKLVEYGYEIEETAKDRTWKRDKYGNLENKDGMKYKLEVKW